jgi:hypothetical protein
MANIHLQNALQTFMFVHNHRISQTLPRKLEAHHTRYQTGQLELRIHWLLEFMFRLCVAGNAVS